MNWKEMPNLFANGKFKIKIIRAGGSYIEDNPSRIVIEGNAKAGDNKLIARPIEDMTDEELMNIYKITNTNYVKGALLEQAINNKMLGRNERYLLSIGVYPFEDTTDVIFKGKKG